jgi:acyl carrier protein
MNKTERRGDGPMSELTLEKLWTTLAECAGEADGTAADADTRDVEFQLLGYDSIALMEITSRLERDHGIRFEDDAVGKSTTPQMLLDMVNRAIADAA